MQTDHGRTQATDRDALAELFDGVRNDAGSWCNLAFEEIAEPDEPDSAFFSFLAARGPSNPLVTVLRESPKKPLSVGIQHRAGVKAAEQLREEQISLPQGARVRQDHPRRGLVVEWPDDAQSHELVDWVLAAVRILNRAYIGEALVWSWSRNGD